MSSANLRRSFHFSFINTRNTNIETISTIVTIKCEYFWLLFSACKEDIALNKRDCLTHYVVKIP